MSVPTPTPPISVTMTSEGPAFAALTVAVATMSDLQMHGEVHFDPSYDANS
jgi:hypothetical protein